MNYKVLYRKYRPDTFDKIIGQDYIVNTLKHSIISNTISHAYIFSGPRGTGKTSTAKIFSQAINCLNPVDGSPCGKCDFCLNSRENPDIIEIDAASNNGVDEIRSLIDNIKLMPTNGKYKVYIIDEVHMLTNSAFNALLLTLEEPPAHSIFILATTNIENVPITILSRCQRFDFQKIKVSEITERLKEISEIEKIVIDDESLEEIAYISEGCMRDALSLLDQLSQANKKITVSDIENQIKTVSLKNINELLNTIENNDITECLKIINDYRLRAVDYKYLVKKVIDVLSNKARDIKLTNKKERLSFEDYKDLILKLSESIAKINISVDNYIILEMIFLDYFDLDNEKKIKPKLIESEKITDDLEDNLSKKEEKKDYEELINIRINNCFVNVKKTYLEAAKKKMEKCQNSLNITGNIKSILFDSSVVAASDKYWILTINNGHLVDKANKMLNEIEKIIKNELKEQLKIIFITEERWVKEKENYINKIKNKYSYKLIDEKELMSEDNENVINDVFDLSKVEII